jgi:hypothetical protein
MMILIALRYCEDELTEVPQPGTITGTHDMSGGKLVELAANGLAQRGI